MPKFLALCNCHNSPDLGELTAHRPLATAPFLGRYAFIDFALSNFTNSGVEKIGLLVKHYPSDVLMHLGSNNLWNANTKTGFVQMMFNEKGILNQLYNTDINNILSNKWVFNRAKADYIIVAPIHIVTCIDYRPIIEKHIKSNAKITAVYKPIKNGREEFIGSSVVRISEKGLIDKIYENRGTNDNINVSLETYIINFDVFKSIIKRAKEVSDLFGLNEIIAYLCSRNLEVTPYRYNGFTAMVDSLSHYVNESFDLLNYRKRLNLFSSDWPFYTRTHDTPPLTISYHANVRNSFIANGALIRGELDSCIVSRNVLVEDGAKLKNCIVFAHTIIGKDTIIENAIIDRDVVIKNTKEIIGTPENPKYIRAGEQI